MSVSDKVVAWLQLTRFDKPVGTELLLYPTLWTLLLASLPALPEARLWFVFTFGVVFMRAAGCAINDFADRRVDGHVKRTKGRPLADGRLSARTAVYTFVGLCLLSACLLFWLPRVAWFWACVSAAFAFVYPFCKRYTHFAQVVLALAFGMGVPMAYVGATGGTQPMTWLLLASYMCWTVAYDTQYAMCDRDDDLKVGIKSIAIWFGSYDLIAIICLQGLFLLGMAWVLGHFFGMAWLGLLPVLLLFVYQYRLTHKRCRMGCFTAFLHNVWVGRYLFLLILLLCLMG